MSGYFDNSATTFVSPAVADAVYNALQNNNGNPSSLYDLGIRAEQTIRSAKDSLALMLGCTPQEVHFTSGGTEANNTALFGAARALKRRGNKIVTSSAEHSSVLDCIHALENEGFSAAYIAPNAQGETDIHSAAAQIDKNTVLISFMLVNNETGAINQVNQLCAFARKKAPLALIHCDCVSALGKMPVSVKKLDADLVSVSAHKIYGPKGIGALYIKKGVRIVPLLYGGHQQNKIRPGTECVPLIAGFDTAIRDSAKNLVTNAAHAHALNIQLRTLLASDSQFQINSPENACPYLLNFSTGRVKSETMLHFLESNGFYVSSGSACAKGTKSHVLAAMGLEASRSDSAIRVSFGKDNTQNDVTALFHCIKQGVSQLHGIAAGGR